MTIRGARTTALDPTRIGRTFFALSLVGLGLEHFLFTAFVAGRAPAWPPSVPGGPIWAYVSGLLIVGSGVALLAGKRAREAALLVAIIIASWALLRHIPVLAGEAFLSGAWTRAGKALMLTGGALAIAASVPFAGSSRRGPLVRLLHRGAFIIAGQVCLGVFLVIAGIQHFMFTSFVVALIPSWFPGNATAWAYFAGVALVCGGVGLMVPFTARLAALMSGLMVFSWFWIVHVPRTFVGVSDSIAVFEALAVSGIALVLSGQVGAAGDVDDPRARRAVRSS
jgi:uncharacterized membrane protein